MGLYFSTTAVLAICTSCIISLALVILGMRLFYHGETDLIAGIALCAATCALTMALGSAAIYHVAGHFLKLLEPVNKAVGEIAAGKFDTRIPVLPGDRKGADYLHELDELRINVNSMANELAGMDHMRKDFISNVSHETKTPVAAIMGFTEMLLEGGLSEEERREYLMLLHDEARRISRLSESMLSISRLDNQTILTRLKTIRVDEQIRKTIIFLSENQPEREFEIDIPEITFDTDGDLLQEVWINLIDNAMKYSDARTTISVSGEVSERGFCISIKDEGCGIPADKLPHVFDMFYQCEESHKKSGSGLGLSIVKRILELLGGGIECHSSEGKGTEMTVGFETNI